MRAGAAALAAGLLAIALASGSQPEQRPADVPEGVASLRGRVVHGERPAAVGGVEIVLYALPAGGPPGIRHGVSDAEGRFAFEGISGDPETSYLVGARFAGVPFPGARIRFAPSETLHEVEVPITDVGTRAEALAVEQLELRLEWRGATLLVHETLALRNDSPRTVYVPEEQRAQVDAPLRVTLPAGAGELQLPLGLVPEGLVRTGDALVFHGPIYPGSQELGWSYALPASRGEVALGRPLAQGAERIVVLVPAGGPEPRAPGLRRAAEEAVVQGQRYLRFEGEDFAPGRTLELALAVPAARTDPAAVSVAEARIVIELDAAALRASEEHLLHVAGDTPVVGADGAPLVRIPLPKGVEELRFGASAAGLGLAPDPEGGLAVLGPLPPGDSSVELSYRIAVAPGPVLFERSLRERLPLLSIYVADDGRLEVASERLHRRRSVQSSDRSYVHLEAFEVEAGERIALQLAPLPPRAGLSRPALLGLLALLCSGIVWLLVAPLRATQSAVAEHAEEADEPDTRREREALYAALRDLEHDHETQKVDDADYALMREEIRGRAVGLLRAEREAGRADREAPAAPAGFGAAADEAAACPACQRPSGREDRFCARCGTRLQAVALRGEARG